MATAGPSGQDGESLYATSSVPNKVLDTSEALDADSAVQDEVLVSDSCRRHTAKYSTRLDDVTSKANLSELSGV